MRLFLAIDPGDDCRRQLAAFIEKTRARTTGIRWVNAEKLQITMAFLGDVEEARVERIVSRAHDVVLGHAPFEAAISGTGVFPNWRRPRVVWLGIKDDGRLETLGADIHGMCSALGFPSDHPFRAHLTIGRVSQPLKALQRDDLKTALISDGGPYHMAVTRVRLMLSKLGAGGSVYSELASFSLGGA